ncbi:membrane protein [Bacterioplanes sanyensis]|uniref:energy-coupling factor ABC transporter permease n=1 Tax=Bacterioplanes sanyensis TaxID=1249553 RepID=UPI0016740ECC|nr:energy-coupling factor ABC transporter permease [Bacterioplanes sanyensis]GGY37088.1 membrane protein [Bacterioplanes sanyensis]
MTPWYDTIPTLVQILTAVSGLAVAAWALLGSNWQALREHSTAQHLFAGSVLVMATMWAGSAGVRPGLDFYLLGYTAAVLMMGLRLALVAGLLALLLNSIMVAWLQGDAAWPMLGYRYLVQIALPMLFSYGFYRWVYLRMAHNPFIYMLVAGFFNAGFTHAVADLLNGGALWALGVYSAEQIWHDYLRYFPLTMFPEGIVNGMFIAGMVAFHPLWLSTFDEESYFR